MLAHAYKMTINVGVQAYYGVWLSIVMARTLSHGRRRKVFSCTGGLVCAVLGRKTLGFPAFFSSVYPWLQTLSSRSHDPQLHCSSSSSHGSNLHVCHGIRVHATSASHDTDNCEEKAVISAKIQGMKEGLLSGKRASLAEAITLGEREDMLNYRNLPFSCGGGSGDCYSFL